MVNIYRTKDMDEEQRNQAPLALMRQAQERRETAEPRNVVDPEAGIDGLLHLLRFMELNRRYREKKRKGGSRRERLQGLFGGNR